MKMLPTQWNIIQSYLIVKSYHFSKTDGTRGLSQIGQKYKDKCQVVYSCVETKNADLREERLVISKEQK